jgi:hypothetical protein
MESIINLCESEEINFDANALKMLQGLDREKFIEKNYSLEIKKTELDDILLIIETNNQLKGSVQIAVSFGEYVVTDNNGRRLFKKQGNAYTINKEERKLVIKSKRDRDFFDEPFMCDTLFFDCTADFNVTLVVQCFLKKN